MGPWKGEDPLEKAKIDRINALAAKSKAQGLTGPEKEEQAALRQEFLADFRAGFKAQLENTYIIGPDGVKRPVVKKK